MSDMQDPNTSDGGGYSKVSDFGYVLYRQQIRLIFGPMLVGFATGICLYGFLPIFDLKTWRIYFQYVPLAVSVGFSGLAVLVGGMVCPPSKQMDFQRRLSLLNSWRELDARNKTRLILGALVAVIAGFMIGWAIAGWTISNF